MSLIECRECHQQISDTATCCPHCGAKNRDRSPGMFAYLVAVVAALVVGFLMYGFYLNNRPHAKEARAVALRYEACMKIVSAGLTATDASQCEKMLDDFQANYGYRPTVHTGTP